MKKLSFLLVLLSIGCSPKISKYSPLPTNSFNINRWRHLLKEDIEKTKNDIKCYEFEKYFDKMVVSTEQQIPAWDSISIESVYDFIGKEPIAGNLCIVTLENKGEVYQNETLIFWIVGKECIGAFWKDRKLVSFSRPKNDYEVIRNMSTLCDEHYTAFGQIIVTEIQEEKMYVKTVLFPSIEQENTFYNFINY